MDIIEQENYRQHSLKLIPLLWRGTVSTGVCLAQFPLSRLPFRMPSDPLDASQRCTGPDDDRSRPGTFLQGWYLREERALRDDAELRDDGNHHPALGVLITAFAFNAGTSFIGGLHHAFMHDVHFSPRPRYRSAIPVQTFMVYQLMFAIITPALITGAFAERMKFSAMLLFIRCGADRFYLPMAHMVWGKGGLLNAFLGGTFRRSTSRAARWCTSRPAFPRSFARSTLGKRA